MNENKTYRLCCPVQICRSLCLPVAQERNAELHLHARQEKVRALNRTVSNAVPTVTLLVTLTAYAGTGRPVLESTIFTAISLFNQLRFPLFFYPMFVDALARGRSALRRMSDFLALEEIVADCARKEAGPGRVSVRV